MLAIADSFVTICSLSSISVNFIMLGSENLFRWRWFNLAEITVLIKKKLNVSASSYCFQYFSLTV